MKEKKREKRKGEEIKSRRNKREVQRAEREGRGEKGGTENVTVRLQENDARREQ